MSTRPSCLQDLPPLTNDMCSLHVLREQGYVSFVLQRANGEHASVFTLHRVEAKKLAERLAEVLGCDGGTHTFVEGAYIGGPPTPDQIIHPK